MDVSARRIPHPPPPPHPCGTALSSLPGQTLHLPLHALCVVHVTALECLQLQYYLFTNSHVHTHVHACAQWCV